MKELVASDLSRQTYYHIQRMNSMFSNHFYLNYTVHAPGAQRSGYSLEMQREEGLTGEGGGPLRRRDDFRGVPGPATECGP